jgi:RHS repeat-associated protein
LSECFYDAWGNLLQKNVTKCAAETLSVAALANNRLSGYSYDAAGNMLSDGFHSYAYNGAGMLTAVDSGAASYLYAAGGERVYKSTSAGATEYYYFGGNAIAERNVSTGGWTNYIFFNGKRVARRDPSGAVHYYLGDHLGSTSMVVSSSGAIENESEFYPFGAELQFSASADNHYKFTGKERDAESGLDYFGARNYSSTLGRWISADPTLGSAHGANPQTWNRYSYTLNSPLSNFDPDGRETVSMEKGQRYEQLVKIIAKDYRKPSFREEFRNLAKDKMVHKYGHAPTKHTTTPGSPAITLTPGITDLTMPKDKNGRPDFSRASTETRVDLDRPDADHITSHETEHVVQVQTDITGFVAAAIDQGSAAYQALENKAESFADKVDNERPDMSQEQAEKEVRELMPEPKSSDDKGHDTSQKEGKKDD